MAISVFVKNGMNIHVGKERKPVGFPRTLVIPGGAHVMCLTVTFRWCLHLKSGASCYSCIVISHSFHPISFLPPHFVPSTPFCLLSISTGHFFCSLYFCKLSQVSVYSQHSPFILVPSFLEVLGFETPLVFTFPSLNCIFRIKICINKLVYADPFIRNWERYVGRSSHFHRLLELTVPLLYGSSFQSITTHLWAFQLTKLSSSLLLLSFS